MSLLVQLWKVEDTAESAVYLYGAKKDESGRLRISKKDKAVSFISPVPGFSDKEEIFFYRDLAAVKLKMLAAKDHFPDEAYIAT